MLVQPRRSEGTGRERRRDRQRRTWLEHLVFQLSHHLGHKRLVRVHEERHRFHQVAAVVETHLLRARHTGVVVSRAVRARNGGARLLQLDICVILPPLVLFLRFRRLMLQKDSAEVNSDRG